MDLQFSVYSEVFASWSQFVICLGVALALWAIFHRGFTTNHATSTDIHDHSRDPATFHLPSQLGMEGERHDACFLYLALACAVWSFVGLVQGIGLAQEFLQAETLQQLIKGRADTENVDFPRAALSLVNSCFILLAAAYLDVLIQAPPRYLRGVLALVRDRAWWVVVVVFTGVGLALTFLLLRLGWFKHVGNIADFAISIATLGILVHGLKRSFEVRGFHLLAQLSIAALALQSLAQLPELDKNLRNLVPAAADWGPWVALVTIRWPLVLSSKVVVMALFLALAFSWMHWMRERDRRRANAQPALTPVATAGETVVAGVEGSSALDDSGRLILHAPVSLGGKVFQLVYVTRGARDHYSVSMIQLSPKQFLRLLELALFRCLGAHAQGHVAREELFEGDLPGRLRTDYYELHSRLGEHADWIAGEEGSRWITLRPSYIDIDFASLRRWDNKDLQGAQFLQHLKKRFPKALCQACHSLDGESRCAEHSHEPAAHSDD